MPRLQIQQKLKILKLKEWSRTTPGELNNKKKNFLEEFVVIDLIQKSRNLTEDEVMTVATIIVKLKYLAVQEESILNKNKEYYDKKKGTTTQSASRNGNNTQEIQHH